MDSDCNIKYEMCIIRYTLDEKPKIPTKNCYPKFLSHYSWFRKKLLLKNLFFSHKKYLQAFIWAIVSVIFFVKSHHSPGINLPLHSPLNPFLMKIQPVAWYTLLSEQILHESKSLLSYCSPWWLYQFTFPLTVQEGSLFSTPSTAFIVSRFFDDGHSDWCEMISHCSFDLHFSND